MSMPVATIKDVDEYGPIIDWHQHWSEMKGRDLFTHLAQPAQAVDAELARKLIEIVRKQCGGYLSGPGHDALMVAKALDEALSVQKAGPVGDGESAAVAAIQFALNAEQGMDWLRLWNEGNFDACREEWPEAPAECYIGADPSLPSSPTPGKEGA